MREYIAKISAQYYRLVVPVLFVQLTRISLVKFLIILLVSTRLGEGGIILFNASYPCITIKFGDLMIERIEGLEAISLSKIS